MREILPRIHAAGAELVIVGNGTPQHAAWFIEDYAITSPVLTDPAKRVYDAVGARRGLRSVLHPRMLWRGLHVALRRPRLFLSWLRAPFVRGDGWQEGGVLVIMPDGRVPWRYISLTAGDHPHPAEVALALERALHTGTAR